MFDLLGLLTRLTLSAQPMITPAAIPLAAAPGAVAVAPQDAGAIVDNVQKFYAGIHQVTASFRQTVTNQTFGSSKTSDGSVWIAKPGKMRWDYIEKRGANFIVKKSFISNGSTLYVIELDNKQVVRKNLQQDLMPVAVSFLYGKGDLKTEFTAEVDKDNAYAAKGEVTLRMTPKKPSAQYKTLFLVVNPSNYRVTQSIIVDSSNNTNHFRFYSPDFEKPVDAKWFEFDAKKLKDYRIIDADQQQPPPAPAIAPKTK